MPRTVTCFCPDLFVLVGAYKPMLCCALVDYDAIMLFDGAAQDVPGQYGTPFATLRRGMHAQQTVQSRGSIHCSRTVYCFSATPFFDQDFSPAMLHVQQQYL